MTRDELDRMDLRKRFGHLTPLMAAKAASKGDVVNFCPYGCEDHQLDENGYCGHLIGFVNAGQKYYEPRVNDATGQVGAFGSNKKPMEKKFHVVWGTTTGRVYSRKLDGRLVPKLTDESDKVQARITEEERRLTEMADAIRNPPREDGEWGDSVYDSPAPLEKSTA